MLLIVGVFGGLYSGVFTVTEAASVAAVLAFLIAVVRRRMSWTDFLKGLREAASTTAMLYVILIGAFVFTYFITAARIPEALVQVIQGFACPATGDRFPDTAGVSRSSVPCLTKSRRCSSRFRSFFLSS